MTRIRIMCDQTDGTTIKLGDIETDETGDTLYSAHPRHVPGHRHPRPAALDNPPRTIQPNHQPTRQGRRMSIDLTQQALNALADAGLGNDSPAEAYVIGYTQGHDDALALAIRIEQSINATQPTAGEIERLAINLWEHNGERPTVYESGKRIADRELEWWKQVAVSAWSFINGTEKEQ
ncbi:hypothetical protein [Bifidobacterium adolescentis]|nr:hypothetical protein [Bifidobacterium adolescentis]